MRKLILGCGYLGERVAQHWRCEGHTVFVLTRTIARARRFTELGFESVIGDILDVPSLARLPMADDVLFAVGYDKTANASKRRVYVDGLRNALQELRRKCSRISYVSSTSVYGQNDGSPVDESSPTSPESDDGRICHDAESLVWQFMRRSPMEPSDRLREAIVLRLAGIYGPGRLLTRIGQLRAGEKLSGNPNAWLNLIHIEDAVQAVLAAEKFGKPGEVYLVSDDRPMLRRDYYAALATHAGAPLPVFAETDDQSDANRRLNKRCVNRRLRTELQVKLKFPTFIDGLRSLNDA